MTPDAIDRLCERIAKLHATASLDEHEAAMNDVRAALEGERESFERLRGLLRETRDAPHKARCSFFIADNGWAPCRCHELLVARISAALTEPRDPVALEEA